MTASHPIDIATAPAAALCRRYVASREEEDKRHGAAVTDIAVVRWFGLWESHELVVPSFVVFVTLKG